MNKWDVVLLSYPFTDLQAVKVRPAVVISPNSFNAAGQDGMFILITSNLERLASYDVLIRSSHPEYPMTGLRKDSVIRTSKIMTLSKSLVSRTIGNLGSQLSLEVEGKLKVFFELSPYQPPLSSPTGR